MGRRAQRKRRREMRRPFNRIVQAIIRCSVSFDQAVQAVNEFARIASATPNDIEETPSE